MSQQHTTAVGFISCKGLVGRAVELFRRAGTRLLQIAAVRLAAASTQVVFLKLGVGQVRELVHACRPAQVLAVDLFDSANILLVDVVALGFFLGRVSLVVLAFELLPAQVVFHHGTESPHFVHREEKRDFGSEKLQNSIKSLQLESQRLTRETKI